MQQSRTIEIGVGLFVAAGLAAIFVLAMKVSNIAQIGDKDGYQVSARFENVGGLKVRSPITMGGVRIGRVADIRYDDRTYEAVVTLNIEGKYQRIPEDSSANIYTAGLLGEQYVSIQPGGSEAFLENGGRIAHTQGSLVLEQLIGQFLFSKADEGPAVEGSGAGAGIGPPDGGSP